MSETENPIPLPMDPSSASDRCDDIDTSRSLLPNGSVHDFVVKSAKVGPNSKKTGDTLSIQWQPTSETVTDHRNEVVSGKMVSVAQFIGLTETEGRKTQNIKRDIATVAKATGLGHFSWRDIVANPACLVGKVAKNVKVKIKPETDEFPESNAISAFLDVK